MGGQKAAVDSKVQQAVQPKKEPEKKTARGGFFGAQPDSTPNLLGEANSRRATFLGY
jgi:hypothetical protein